MQYHPDTGICVTRIPVSENFIGGIITMFLEATTTATTNGGSWLSLLIFPLLLVVMYFFMIRPQKKKDKQVKDMLAALKKGDRVCTIGGIYGTIEHIKDDTITLAVGKDHVNLVFARWAIRSVEEVSIENDAEALN